VLIRMTVDLSGPGVLLAPGDEREFPQDEAVRLIAAGFAVPVAASDVELAVKSPPAEVRNDARPAPTVEFRRKGKRR
jgi:hypothetical protein